MKRLLIFLTRPVVLMAIVTVMLLMAGTASYPVKSVAVSAIKPSSKSTHTEPTINQPISFPTNKPAKANHPLPKLALSFDDGPNPMTTPLILETLEKEHVHASFFVVGSRVKGNEKILQRMYRDGDDIGNHSWNHPDFTFLNRAQIASQINRTQRAVAAAGVPPPFMFRPPYGATGPHFPKELPLAIVLWNIDPEDWGDQNTKVIEQKIISQARPGGIIDMHDIYLSTAQAIRPAIKKLKKHYQLVTVSDLLGIKPGDTGKFYGYR